MTDVQANQQQQQQKDQVEEHQDTAVAVPHGPEPEHSLCDTWCLFYDNPTDLPDNPTDAQYKANLKKVYEFNTLEQFWRLFSNMKGVEELIGCNLHLFRGGVSPTWEDPFNAAGGKWVCNIPISAELWMRTVLSVIGGMYDEHQDQVCGAVAALKRNKKRDRLSLWTKHENDEKACKAIGRKWKEICGKDMAKIEYLPHKRAQKSRSSYFSDSKYIL